MAKTNDMQQSGYRISTDLSLLDLNMVYNYLSKESYWAKGIAYERLEKAISNSFCFGVYNGSFQVGFARVISDKATFAYLCDVFILSPYRGLGLSKMLMLFIRSHPDLAHLRRWVLATEDAHFLYHQFGFTSVAQPKNWMEILTPYS